MIPQVPARGDTFLQLPLQDNRGASWRVGSTLQAVVIDATAKGRVQLQIGNQTVSARTAFPLREGQDLSLRVSRNGRLVVLQPLRNAAAEPAQQALRQALPRHSGQAPLLANLQQVATGGNVRGLGQATVDAAQRVLQNLLPPQDLTKTGALRQAVKDSGVFLEARLLSLLGGDGSAPPVKDYKAALLRLYAALQGAQTGATSGSARGTAPPLPLPQSAQGQTPSTAPQQGAQSGVAEAGVTAGQTRAATMPATTTVAREPPPPLRDASPQPQLRTPATLPMLETGPAARELLRQVEGALARVELSQLASLPTDKAETQAWLLDLPLRTRNDTPDLIQMRIAREKSGSGEEDGEWSVTLAFDLGAPGPMQARVSVRGETVAALFTVADDVGAEQLRGRLDELRERLSGRGLDVGNLGCRQGSLSDSATHTPGRLLETEA